MDEENVEEESMEEIQSKHLSRLRCERLNKTEAQDSKL